MERSANSKGQSPRQVQPEDGNQQQGQFPSKMLHPLQRALLDSKRKNELLAAENDALKKQVNSWEEEKKNLLDKRDSLVSTLYMTRSALDNLVKDFESVKARNTQYEANCMEMAKRIKEKEEEVYFLGKDLHLWQIEVGKIENLLRVRCNQLRQMELSFTKSIAHVNAEWEKRLTAREEKAVAELKALQTSCDEKVEAITREKDTVINSTRTEKMALIKQNLELLTRLKSAETRIHSSKTKWQAKVDTVEECLRFAKNEREELQKKTADMQEKWLAKEEDWTRQTSRMEEDIQRLTEENIQLQELASKSDKDKAKIKKEEEKAKKEAEKKLKEEMKKQKKQEKKEREEREKKEKKERKEKEAQEKKEKEERKKKEKRERKEREEQEKKEKEERKKREKMERKEKREQEKDKVGIEG
ncbi:golgin subfamily A member 6-like protein 1 [Trachinotus anak]|uniref:golgin subfamily A member 6-like protein 1 n=1 Tax=Trachinotus anak TaxID=443729 RepID=UPI0039F24102